MRISPGGHPVVGGCVGFPHIEPVAGRYIFHPPVRASAMVGHYVDYHFDTMISGSLWKAQVIFVFSRALINFVVIRTTVMMVWIVRVIVVKQRSSPESCNSQIGQVRNFPDYSFNISSLPVRQIAAVYTPDDILLRCRSTNYHCKAVGHQQVHVVFFRKTFAVGRVGCSLFSAHNLRPVFSPFWGWFWKFGSGFGRNIQIYKQIVRIVCPFNLCYRYSRIIDG